MSPAMTLTVASPPLTPQPSGAFTTDLDPTARCPNCGSDALRADDAESELARAQSHISDLEVQIRQLNEKATAAIYRCAAYEEELSRLRNLHSPPPGRASSTSSPFHSPLTSRSPSVPRTSPPNSGSFLSSSQRLSSLLSPRKSSPNLRANGADSAGGLAAELAKEKALRAEAEEAVRRTGEEAEELSAAVFERANEMVAEERRARAGLEERVMVLEGREKGRRKRLEVLEGAVERIESLRALLGQEKERERKGRSPKAREAGSEDVLLRTPPSPGRPSSVDMTRMGSRPLEREEVGT